MAESFSIAVREHFGDNTPESGPPTEQLEDVSREADSRVHKIMKDGLPVGGAILKINNETQHNKIDLFFIFKEYLNHGLGLEATNADFISLSISTNTTLIPICRLCLRRVNRSKGRTLMTAAVFVL